MRSSTSSGTPWRASGSSCSAFRRTCSGRGAPTGPEGSPAVGHPARLPTPSVVRAAACRATPASAAGLPLASLSYHGQGCGFPSAAHSRFTLRPELPDLPDPARTAWPATTRRGRPDAAAPGGLMKPRSGEYTHLIRMAGLFVVGIAAFLLVRWLLVPADFGLLRALPGRRRDGQHGAAGEVRGPGGLRRVPHRRRPSSGPRASTRRCRASRATARSPPTRQNPDGVKPEAARPPQDLHRLPHGEHLEAEDVSRRWYAAEHAPEGPCTECHVGAQPEDSPDEARS